MRVRTQLALIQFWVALVCALGAGFSGDLFAHHTGHVSHTSRHSRGAGNRSSRGLNRDGYSDHSAEVELPSTHDAQLLPAVVPETPVVAPQFEFVAWIAPFRAAEPRAAEILALPARGPPALS